MGGAVGVARSAGLVSHHHVCARDGLRCRHPEWRVGDLSAGRRHAVGAVKRQLVTPIDLGKPARPDPDILHVVVDGMGRGDVLEDTFGIDQEHSSQLSAAGLHMCAGCGRQLPVYLSGACRDAEHAVPRRPFESVGRFSGSPTLRAADWREFCRAVPEGARLPIRPDRIRRRCDGRTSAGRHQRELRPNIPRAVRKRAPGDLTAPRDWSVGLLLRRSSCAHRQLHRLPAPAATGRVQAEVSPRPLALPHPPFLFGPSGARPNPRRAFSGQDGAYYPGTADEDPAKATSSRQFTPSSRLPTSSGTSVMSRRTGSW